MIRHGEPSEDKGVPTCPTGEVTSIGGTRHPWSAVRNNANNAWNVNLNNGNMNNNNTNNRYSVAGASELSEDEIMRFLLDEEECYKNKHDSAIAARYHYNLSLLYRIIVDVHNGTWRQGPAIVFAIAYPTLREVWAADYGDRILHHDVAPIISDAAERVHTINGDVSHGNRIGHSAHTAALQIRQNMAKRPEGVVGKRDLSGFFMSIPRASACDYILRYVTDDSKNDMIRKLVLHDPTKLCKIMSPMAQMQKIPHNKSLFYAKNKCGLPIGNFYSQLVANAYLGSVDALANSAKWKGKIGYTRFVDDICVVGDGVESVNEFFKDAQVEIEKLGLRLNERKIYTQPVSHGVSFCGRTIHAHGIYINNRTVKACKTVVNQAPPGLQGAKRVVASLNSYFGFFKHCKAYNIQKRIAGMTMLKYGKYIGQKLKEGQIVSYIAHEYTGKAKSNKNIDNFIRELKTGNNEIRKRNGRQLRHRKCLHTRRSRKVQK